MEAIQATAADGVVLRGEVLRGPTTTWVVMIHDVGDDLDEWRPLVDALAPRGWNLLAIDLRGHGGSGGTWDATRAALDVDLAVNLARRSGAEHIAVAAAGSAAIAALECVARAVEEPSFALADSLVLLSPGPIGDAELGRLRGEGLATLILSAANEPRAADIQRLRRASIGWTVGVTFAGDSGGTGLLAGPYASHVADKVSTFLREQAVLTGPGFARLRPS